MITIALLIFAAALTHMGWVGLKVLEKRDSLLMEDLELSMKERDSSPTEGLWLLVKEWGSLPMDMGMSLNDIAEMGQQLEAEMNQQLEQKPPQE